MLAAIMVLALALGGAAVDDTDVTCALQAEGVTPGEERGPERFTARCPSDHPEAQAIQAATDAALGAVSLPLPEPIAGRGGYLYGFADSLIMTRGSDGWSPAPGQHLVNVEPELSQGVIVRGGRYAACALELRPDAAGVPVAPRVRCLSGEATPRVREIIEPAMLGAAERMRFAPSATPYCVDWQVLLRARAYDMDRREFEAPPEVTDADDLPNLCELDVQALAAQTGLYEMPVTADCLTAGDVQRRRVTGFQLVCPDDAPEAAALQAYADAIAAQTGGVIDMSGDYAHFAEAVTFEFEDGEWRLPGPARIRAVEPRYPPSAAERGLDGVCALAYQVGPDGRAREIRVTCRAIRFDGVAQSGALFERVSRDAIAGGLWLAPPGSAGDCTTTQLHFATGERINTDRRPWLSAPVPDAPVCED